MEEVGQDFCGRDVGYPNEGIEGDLGVEEVILEVDILGGSGVFGVKTHGSECSGGWVF